MITFENVNFTYPNSPKTAIKNISLTINQGEMVLVTGVSGSGKSTLLRCINGLVPHFSGGSISGNIRVAGHDPVQESPKALCKVVGFVFQDPESQFVMDQVEDEIAFVLENFALPPDEIEKCIDLTLSIMNLKELRHRSINDLSGGEQQRVAIASVMAMQPSILVLDEPTSQLDPVSADNLLLLLKELNKNQNLTIVLSEHRLERIIPYIDRIIHLDPEGNLIAAGRPREVFQQINIQVPIIEAAKKLNWKFIPLSIREARQFIQKDDNSFDKTGICIDRISKKTSTSYKDEIKKPEKVSHDSALIQVNNLSFSYTSVPALSNISLDILPGETIALMGANGAGKSTLLRCLVGLLKPQSGEILLSGKNIRHSSVAEICCEIAYLPQNPNMLLFADRVEDELWITLRNHHFQVPPIAPRKLLDQLGLSEKDNQYPRDLSTGERQRVALGAVLITKPKAILLDEPTRGLDYAAKSKLIELLKIWQAEGKAIVLITHDVEFAAQIADIVIILDHGNIIKQGNARDIFSQFPPFTTQIAQVFPDSGWITAQDV